MKLVSKMFKAMHVQKNRKASREKAKAVVEELYAIKPKEAAELKENEIADVSRSITSAILYYQSVRLSYKISYGTGSQSITQLSVPNY